ncbi:NuoI/complex I 23 kDa subunit family protein [Planctomicrobium sp. SH668]|uniref:NuoI/complex I 23 kDa subunit family protein n=1 Tax=Planctomicrobium sp. SH668 TaxID=3448126 RepID=UPI003F5C42D3
MPISSKDVTWVEEPEMNFWEAMFLPAIVTGLKTTFRHVTQRKPVTQQYPEVRPDLPNQYRGVHRLNRDEKDRVKCVACMLCATVCPAHCITIEASPAPPEWPDRDKFPKSFVLDELRCIYCGMCEEACPVDAIELTHIYDMTGHSRESMTFDREKLLSIYDQTKDNPKDPIRTARGKLGPASEFVELPTLSPATQVAEYDRAAKAPTAGVIAPTPTQRAEGAQ